MHAVDAAGYTNFLRTDKYVSSDYHYCEKNLRLGSIGATIMSPVLIHRLASRQLIRLCPSGNVRLHVVDSHQRDTAFIHRCVQAFD